MKGFVLLAAVAATLWFTAAPAGASHEGNASSACCAPSGGSACDEVGTLMNRRGCAETATGPGDSLAGNCIGGTAEPEEGGPWGCLCLADGLCFAGKAPSPALPVTPEECSRLAVEACCAAGACHPVGE